MTAALAQTQITDASRLGVYLDQFCLGRENASTLLSIARQFGWSRRYTERVWLDLRRARGQYASCGDGIFRAANDDELTAYRLQLKGRRDELDETLASVERELFGPGQLRLEA